METLGGFPNLPALWLRRAKPGSANAIASPLVGLSWCPTHRARLGPLLESTVSGRSAAGYVSPAPVSKPAGRSGAPPSTAASTGGLTPPSSGASRGGRATSRAVSTWPGSHRFARTAPVAHRHRDRRRFRRRRAARGTAKYSPPTCRSRRSPPTRRDRARSTRTRCQLVDDAAVFQGHEGEPGFLRAGRPAVWVGPNRSSKLRNSAGAPMTVKP